MYIRGRLSISSSRPLLKHALQGFFEVIFCHCSNNDRTQVFIEFRPAWPVCLHLRMRDLQKAQGRNHFVGPCTWVTGVLDGMLWSELASGQYRVGSYQDKHLSP